MWVTIILFCAVYLLLFVAWVRIVSRFVKEGPERLANEPAKGVNVLPIVTKSPALVQAEAAAAAAKAASAAPEDENAKGGE